MKPDFNGLSNYIKTHKPEHSQTKPKSNYKIIFPIILPKDFYKTWYIGI